MANSKLLKEAIADAKAVRETAIANAKIALEEAFTPRLQSILSKKLQAEMEGDDEEIEEELDSSDIGDGTEETPVEPSADAADAHTELGAETEEESDEVGEEDENVDVVSEEEDHEEVSEEEHGEEEVSEEDEVEVEDEIEEEDEIEDEDELDLEAIIRELEGEIEEEDSEYEETYEGEEEEYEEGTYEGEGHGEEEIEEADGSIEDPTNADDASISEEEHEEEETIDLEEILREMGYGDDEEEVSEEEEGEDHSELEAELEEAYSTIKELQSTINEVNLLNAKLLYANKLFRGYALTNEQKAKVVENLDRTTSVREVKLVYATLAESMNFVGTEKKSKRAISESVAPKATKSTAPTKEVITESANVLAERFKKLANIK
jgi:hypothetical protein